MPVTTHRDDPQSQRIFLTTRWSVVLAARDKDSPKAGDALEALCQTYWLPLYSYARWRGNQPHDAEDLTQDFFARLVEDDYLQAVKQEKGRFRIFLLMAFKRFMAKQWMRSCALKRGGKNAVVALDTQLAERLHALDPHPGASADQVYDQRWALALLEGTVARLRTEFAETGKAADFELLKPFLASPRGEINYTELATALGASESAARMTVHRFRKRYREVLREEISHTVADKSDFEDEVRHLISVLGTNVG
jgi:RNA polymerase sigma-70 factor (ECF subfamily)